MKTSSTILQNEFFCHSNHKHLKIHVRNEMLFLSGPGQTKRISDILYVYISLSSLKPNGPCFFFFCFSSPSPCADPLLAVRSLGGAVVLI